MPFPDQFQTIPPQVQPNRFEIPSQIVVGDQFEFRIANQAPYTSAGGWTYALSLRRDDGSPQANIDLASSIDAGQFLIEADENTTGAWQPGRYLWQLYAAKGFDRETTQSGQVTLLANLFTITAPVDLRSHARRVLDRIEALIEGRVNDDILDSTIDNTRFTRMNPEQLLIAHSYYTAKVRQEEARLRAKNGLATGRNILCRFTRP